MVFKVLSEFDPWKHELCTCPKKYSFNPYTGCAHACSYCYATYIPNFWNVRPKHNLLQALEKDLEKLCAEEKSPLISMSNSSDPYPPLERKLLLTRKCLELFREYEVRVLIITKSDIVLRDIDIFSNLRCGVAISITGFSTKIYEANAPLPEKRIEVLRTLKENGIPVILRLDPLIPWISEKEWFEILERCSFVDHVVTSTLKLRKDSISRILLKTPEVRDFIQEFYLEKGEKIRNSIYLPREMRRIMLTKIEEKCEELGISCAFCREGFEFKAKSCDGSHLIKM